jgi:hypothetical protein
MRTTSSERRPRGRRRGRLAPEVADDRPVLAHCAACARHASGAGMGKGKHTCVRDGVHSASTGVKPGVGAVLGPQMGPQTPRKPLRKANSNRSPRFLSVGRSPANTGETPRKHGGSASAVSPAFAGFRWHSRRKSVDARRRTFWNGEGYADFGAVLLMVVLVGLGSTCGLRGTFGGGRKAARETTWSGPAFADSSGLGG